jgi:hypothetical protein
MGVDSESHKKVAEMLSQERVSRPSAIDFDYLYDCMEREKLSRRRRVRIDALYRKYVEEWI